MSSMGGGGGSMRPFGIPPGDATPFNQAIRDATKERRFETNLDKTIPAGWLYLDILNNGLNVIQVNGDTMSPGGRWNGEEKTDELLRRQELGPAVNIVTNGEPVLVHVTYPIASAVNVNTI